MFDRIKQFADIVKEKSPRYIVFRARYELMRKMGLMKSKFAKKESGFRSISLSDYRKLNNFILLNRDSLNFEKHPTDALKEKAVVILNGDLIAFSNLYFKLGKDYDWVTNPENGYKYDIHKHWSQIEDIVESAGDIKFVWEKSRFCHLLTLMRYDYHFDEDHSEFAINEILDWIEKNPLNYGPNYKCSQEISIRILNWTFALRFYSQSKYLTQERLDTILESIYGQIRHVEKNIDFSRICVRNNHAITETLTLYIISLIYPWFSGSQRRKKKGKQWFEEEILYQIDEDGAFIQESVNYHRVLVQLLTLGIAVSDKIGELFSKEIYRRAFSTLNFLYQMQDEYSGYMPNYGANDGSLFFPLNDNDYRDYRPTLDALYNQLTGKKLYGYSYEDSQWLMKTKSIPYINDEIERIYGLVKFENSGYYLYRDKESLTFVRCGSYKNNNIGTADILHLDVWYKGKNILFDGGSYKYNCGLDDIRYFSGTESHNSLMLNNEGHKTHISRFIWKNAPDICGFDIDIEENILRIKAEIKTFKSIGQNIIWHREISRCMDQMVYEVKDKISGQSGNKMRQLWHLDNNSVNIESSADKSIVTKWVSNYYGSRQECDQIEFSSTSDDITTIIRIH